jgi:putative hydrolase of the HAD superfamily
MKRKYIIFDLDDTLAYEIDYLKSAFLEIALSLADKSLYETMLEKYFNKENVFEFLVKEYIVNIHLLLNQYRNHFPTIKLIDGVKELIDFCQKNNFKLGLITDGRSITQRNKLQALEIEDIFDKIIISEEFGSEKPNENNYLAFVEDDETEFFYIADNPKKDFITPNKLGWISICLLNKGINIHAQNFDVSKEFLPKFIIKNLMDVKRLIS